VGRGHPPNNPALRTLPSSVRASGCAKCGDDLLDHAVGKIQYACSGSPLILANESAAIDGLSGREHWRFELDRSTPHRGGAKSLRSRDYGDHDAESLTA
jgi:hypothetical protein